MNELMESLARSLGDGDWTVRRGAAEALGNIGDERSVRLLIDALVDVDRWVRDETIEALCKIGEPAVEPLIGALGNEDVRNEAVDALVSIGEPAVLPLIKALENEDMRAGAVEALGRIGDERAVLPLIDALIDEDREVRWGAAGALGKIGDTRAVGPLIHALAKGFGGCAIRLPKRGGLSPQ
ncbi:MAG: HEAT repeat domain-containing protein [Euryarchaeota archaeon]|nr:HEAT repeat domain-containing protein [Euryarchaeota archaeon]